MSKYFSGYVCTHVADIGHFGLPAGRVGKPAGGATRVLLPGGSPRHRVESWFCGVLFCSTGKWHERIVLLGLTDWYLDTYGKLQEIPARSICFAIRHRFELSDIYFLVGRHMIYIYT